MTEKLTFKSLFNTVLNGMAVGVVSGLIANAVLSAVFKYAGMLFLPEFFKTASQAVYLLQFAVPVLVGTAIGMTMKFTALENTVLGAALLVASGSIVYNSELKVYTTVPMGDLINVLLIALFATYLIHKLSGKFGSLTIIFLPIIGGGIPALVGLYTLPHVKKITKFLADGVMTFTTLQPATMAVLIALSFSLFIVTPLSTVAMGIVLFSNANYLGAGAAAIGVVSAAAVLMVGSIKIKNPSGVSVAIVLGAIKLMMPNVARTPLLLVPIFATAAVSGLGAWFFNILGDQTSAGFGIIGLIGPLKAIEKGASLLVALLTYVVIPFSSAFLFDKLFGDVLKLYKKDAYESGNYGK
ncbi:MULTISPECIES: PTS sugar transporter subunit IIC [unclassified Gemella]|uniref:PTS sugar transporter subunit IIC n=1 Tax=unclassified Gemella TaxID=2624949 RepID=UPI0010744923|nr:MULTISPECIES: PTS sugar transporter subunit IIC [unclassified Gemella]MBF0710246.1 PTS transporter subunit IIC [Gemella sp. GL1.1]MBF0746326.1 PTS transporter subunit IIC [Gemella sp. 19428wG2_WT2a]NYS27590.1 PTS transporter subunit IIC [Gemella sp. GL1]TFU60602.1 PTS transporter subunit IIC [Gemella sp. WT2a]